ncbi:MAG: hypothetical protein PW788_14740 [Micavibrio sp.]|nr:hypothetical protein [Micavibrio sp.]
MRGLKVLVAVMTLLLALGMGLLVYGLVTKTGHAPVASQTPMPPVIGATAARAPETAETVTTPAANPLPAATDTHELELPALSSVEHVSAWKDGVALYVGTPTGDYIYFVDPASGVSPLRVKIKRGHNENAKGEAVNPGAIPFAQ